MYYFLGPRGVWGGRGKEALQPGAPRRASGARDPMALLEAARGSARRSASRARSTWAQTHFSSVRHRGI